MSVAISEQQALDTENRVSILVQKGCSEKREIIHTQNTSLTITVEENAILDLSEIFQSGHDITVETQIVLHKNATIKHLSSQNLNKEININNIINIQQDKKSNYSNLLINNNAKTSNFSIQNILHGEGAECIFDGVNILDEKQKTHIDICVEHQVPSCTSSQFYRSVLRDWSVCDFNSKSHVFAGAQKTNAKQMSNALLLSSTATMNTKPELEIYADDVECAHGATTGQIDEQQLFYLRSRGIGEEEAKQLLIDAFIAEILEKWSVKNV